jgi:hypothetical protein
MKYRTLILGPLFISLTADFASANQCSALFTETSVKPVVQELARLLIESETVPSRSMKSALRKLYEKKLRQAQKHQIDLAELPSLVEKIRAQETENQSHEEQRKHEAKNNESALGTRWDFGEDIIIGDGFDVNHLNDGAKSSADGHIQSNLPQWDSYLEFTNPRADFTNNSF